MTLAYTAAVAILVSLLFYAVLGGADFGGGIWDLFARGRRAAKQRELITDAIAPVWEANHVWLILALVLLFTCFPRAYAVILTALHVPATLMLLGIVMRGTAFTFRQYDVDTRTHRRWELVFGISSLVTPFFLGVLVGAITSGHLRMELGAPAEGFFKPWLGVFPFAVGFFTMAVFAFLAAVFLTTETDDPELQDDFRRRAIIAGVAVGITALAAGFTADAGTLRFSEHLFGSWWSVPLQIATGLAAVGVFAALFQRRFRWARVFAIAQVALILAGWGLAQAPVLVAPDVTIAAAAAPDVTLRLVLIALAAGSVLLFPSLYWLLRVFKTRPRG